MTEDLRFGELWAVSDKELRWIDGPQKSREGDEEKERFVLILTANAILQNKVPVYVLVVPISSKGYGTQDYVLEFGQHPYSNLTKTSVLRLLMIQPLPRGTFHRKVGRLEKEVMQEILSKALDNMGLPDVDS